MLRRRLPALLVLAALGGSLPSASAASGSAYRRPGINRLVTLSDSGMQAGAASYDPSPSADGSVVAFFSRAGDLVSGPVHKHGNIYARDVAAGRTELMSVAADGGAPNGQSLQAGTSGDGRSVAFSSYATNLVAGDNADAPVISLWQ